MGVGLGANSKVLKNIGKMGKVAGKTLNASSYPVDVLAAYTGYPVAAGLSGVINGNTLIGETLIAQETGQNNDNSKTNFDIKVGVKNNVER